MSPTAAQRAPRAPERVPDAHDERARWREVLSDALERPFLPGNQVTLYRNGIEIFPALLRAIQSAEHTLELETYLYGDDPVADRFSTALAAAAQRGVQVRVVLDGVGSWIATHRQARRLRRSGVAVRIFRPLDRWRVWRRWRVRNRTHRKILVADGREAFTGGAGIAQEWDGDARGPEEWRDTFFRFRGPAVEALFHAFEEHWTRRRSRPPSAPAESRPDEPSGCAEVMVLPSSGGARPCAAATLLHLLPRHARRRLRASTPYFVPDDPLLEALVSCARRGVDVELLVPGPHTDHAICALAGAADLRALYRAGVVIHRYQPTFPHTKTLTVDGLLSVVGTANMNRRSLAHDDEVLVVALDPELASELDRDFHLDVSRARRMTGADAAPPTLTQRILEGGVRLFRDNL